MKFTVLEIGPLDFTSEKTRLPTTIIRESDPPYNWSN